jgi:hypothetical protein
MSWVAGLSYAPRCWSKYKKPSLLAILTHGKVTRMAVVAGRVKPRAALLSLEALDTFAPDAARRARGSTI